MPDSHQHQRTINMETIDTRVSILDNEIKELGGRFVGLEEKFDKVMTGFAEEFRSALNGLSGQFNEKQKPQWGILISGASVVLAICITIGGLAVSPIQTRILKIEEDVVPRKEVEFRDKVIFEKIAENTITLRDITKREFERLTTEVEALKRENNLLKAATAVRTPELH